MQATYIAGYDGSDAAGAAGALAVELGRAAGAQVLAVHAGAADVAPFDRLEAAVHRRLVVEGPPADALRDLVTEHGASLLAVGVTHHRRLGRLRPGSVAAQLLHETPCPVLVVPAGWDARRPALIGVAYDGGREARHALATAVELAGRLESRVVLIGACDLPRFAGPALKTSWDVDPDRRDAFRGLLRDAAAGVDAVPVETRMIVGPATETLLEVAAAVDLLVLGSRGYGRVGRVLLGSVSRPVVDGAPCPVLVVPRAAA
jgi:nucleotide-binding universal stress UspA family protein